MSVKEYSLKFTKLTKYAPTLISKSRGRMNKFVMGCLVWLNQSIVLQFYIMLWISIDSWCITNKLRRPSIERWIGMGRELSRMNQVNLSLRSGFTINALPWWARIGCTTQIPDDGVEVALLLRGLDVPRVENNIWVIVLPVQVCVLYV